MGQPEEWTDYTGRAVDETTGVAKSAVEAHYGRRGARQRDAVVSPAVQPVDIRRAQSGTEFREPTVGSRLSDVTRPDVIERIEMRVTRHVAKLQSPSEFKWASHVWPAFAEPSLTLAAPWGFQTRPAERPVPDRRCQVCERCLGRRQPVTLAVVTVRPCVQFRRSRRWLRARIGTGTCGLFFLLAMAAMARRRTRRLRHAAGNVRA